MLLVAGCRNRYRLLIYFPIYVFISCLFNEPVCSSDCTVPDGRMIDE
jgi:hypothetical protein